MCSYTLVLLNFVFVHLNVNILLEGLLVGIALIELFHPRSDVLNKVLNI